MQPVSSQLVNSKHQRLEPADTLHLEPSRRAAAVGAALVAVLLATPAAQAQADLAHVSFEHVLAAAVEQQQAPADLAFSRLRAQLMVPVVLDRSETILLPRLSYDLTSATVASGADPGLGGPWHALGVGLGAMQVLPRGFRLSAFVQLGLASDFRDLASQSLRIGGSLLGLYQVNPQLSLGLGLVVSNSFGRLRPLPGLLVDWRPTRSLRLSLSFPRQLRLSYTWADRLEVGLLSEVSGNRYAVRDDSAIGSVEHTVVDAKGYGAVRLLSRVWLSAQTGTTLYRRLAIFDGDDTQTASLSMKSGVVFRLSLEFRLPHPGEA